MASLQISFLPFILAILFSLTAFGVGVASLVDYIHQREHLVALVENSKIYDRAFIIVGSYPIFASLFIAIISCLGFALLYLQYSLSNFTKLSWRASVILAVTCFTGDALALTIIVATKDVTYDNVGPHVTVYMDEAVGSSGVPLDYRHDPKVLAAVVFTWVAWLCAIFSCVSLFSGQKKVGVKCDEKQVSSSGSSMGSSSDMEKPVEKSLE
ncbi:uncharacterized protein N7483_005835 [Penicillium malachiteum]|uniref:uncharacterized protein n=1 Tax=Penicillium malachiteum TaxID=1324776 RepID=UPI0025476B7D|nr:uncharacterized protein N7483_005835 [Penicillium malachiteum]KAJ5731327.1 hypothetical protein N7483_005835 [Penicillium malachiteum]